MQSLFKTVDVEAIQFFFFSLSLLALQYPQMIPYHKNDPQTANDPQIRLK